jgi:hypothetical protein
VPVELFEATDAAGTSLLPGGSAAARRHGGAERVGRPELLWVGARKASKGTDTLLRAFSSVDARTGRVCAWSGAHPRTEVPPRAAASSLGVTAAVSFRPREGAHPRYARRPSSCTRSRSRPSDGAAEASRPARSSTPWAWERHRDGQVCGDRCVAGAEDLADAIRRAPDRRLRSLRDARAGRPVQRGIRPRDDARGLRSGRGDALRRAGADATGQPPEPAAR